MAERFLDLWVVYDQPRDYPGHVVVRVQFLARGGDTEPILEPFACLYDTVEEAMRDCEAKGLTWLGRHPQDEPHIVGVWV